MYPKSKNVDVIIFYFCEVILFIFLFDEILNWSQKKRAVVRAHEVSRLDRFDMKEVRGMGPRLFDSYFRITLCL